MTTSPTAGALLLCLDVQAPFLAAMSDPPGLLRRCQLAVGAARLLDLPLLFTTQVPDKLGGTVPALRNLAPAARELPKATFSALADEEIHQAVTEGATEHLILCGLETPVCIYQTALDALNLDLQVTVLTDAVGARRPDDAAMVLRALAGHGAHCLPVETVFYALLHDATHPAFKAYTQLVKSAHGH
jgi:nicotinamidase-related amidase